MNNDQGPAIMGRALTEGWSILQSLTRDRIFIRPVPWNSSKVAYQGIDDRNRRFIAFPVQSATPILEDDTSAGIHLKALALEENGEDRLFVGVVCMMPHLEDLFSIVAADILEEMVTSSLPIDSVCLIVLDRWRELLGKANGHVLSEEELAGIFGELWLLRTLCRFSPLALSCWLGPDQASHDFVGEEVSIEVKTSRSKSWRRVRIHGIEQLMPPQDSSLYLQLLHVEARIDSGESMSSLLDDIEGAGVNRSRLMSRLYARGVSPLHLRQLRTHKFNVIDHELYKVEGSFPRLVLESLNGSQLPPGVSRVDYDIDLSGSSPSPVTGNALDQVLRTLVGRHYETA